MVYSSCFPSLCVPMTTPSAARMSNQTRTHSSALSIMPTSPEPTSPAHAVAAPARSDVETGTALLMDPLREPAAWDALVAAHPNASLFHTSAWARVLHEAYGHTSFYFCRQHAHRPAEILPVMEVNSPWTGRRGVSLPFTDECPPLGIPDRAETGNLYAEALQHGRMRGWKYLETRGEIGPWRGAIPSVAYFGHHLDLARSESNIFAGLDSSVRRAIRKAEQAGLRVEQGTTLESMKDFYQLHCRTRRRHGVPPQPFRFFENITRHVLAAGHGSVFTVLSGSRVLAAAIFFQYGARAIYKFGASDFAFQALRPNNLLMWAAIKSHASQGLKSLHFGRTSLGAEGLRRFKLGFGAQEERLAYCRYDFARAAFVTGSDRAESWFNPLFRCLPLPALRFAGNVLYPHLS